MDAEHELQEITELKQLYAAVEKKKKPPGGGMSIAKPKKLQIRRHSYLTEMDLRRIHYFRYGTEKPSKLSIRSYKEVCRLARLPASTCFYAIKRFESDNYKFVDRRRMNFRKA